MAQPSFVNAGTGATDAGGAWAYTCQASAAAGRIFIVQILQDGATSGVLSSIVGTNIESLDGTDNTWTAVAVNGLVGNPSVGRHHIYIGRALSTSAPTISGANSTSEDLYIRSYQFTDVNTGTTLAAIIENSFAGSTGYENGTSNTAVDDIVTTLGADRLALNFLAVNDDNAIAQFSGQTGGTWVEVAEYADASGTDGAIQLQYAAMATAGTINGGTASITDSDAWGVVGFALIGTGAAMQPITVALIDASAAIYSLSLRYTQIITAALIDGGAAIYGPSVVRAPYPITVALIDAGPAIYAASVAKAPYPITVGLIDGGAAVYSLASIYLDQFVSPALIDGVSTIYAASVVKAPYPITVGLIDSGAAIYAPTLTPKNSLSLDLIDAGPAIYDLTVVHQALPIVKGTSSGGDASATTTHVFNLPSGVQAGDLIFFIATADASTGGITPPVDWLPNTDDTNPSYLGYGGGIIALSYYKIAAGGETTVSFTTVNSMRYQYVAYRISGVWDGYPGDPVSPMLLWAGTSYPYATGTSVDPDPPSVSWPADRDTVWIAVALSSSASVATAAPSGYSGLVTTPVHANSDTISTAHRVVRRSTSEDPGVFTLVYGYWNAYTIGVRGKYFGADGVALGLIPDGPSKVIYSLTLTKKNTIALGLIDSVSAIYAPTVLQITPIALPLIDGARVLVAEDTFTEAGTGVADLSTHTPELGGPWVRAYGGDSYPNDGFIDIDKDNDQAKPSGTLPQGVWDTGSTVYRVAEIGDGFIEAYRPVGTNGTRSALVVRQSGASYYDNFYIWIGSTVYRVTGGGAPISIGGGVTFQGDWTRMEVSGRNPTKITVRTASTQAGLDSAAGTVFTDDTAGNQRDSGYVGIYSYSEDQNGMVYTGVIDDFRAYSRDVIPALAIKNINGVALDLIDSGSAIYAPTLAVGPAAATLSLIDAGSAIYALTVLLSSATLEFALIDSGSAIYAPTLTVGPVGVTLGVIESTPAVYALTLTPKNAVSLGLIDGAPAIFSLAVSRTVAIGLIDSTPAIYAPVVGFSLGLPLIDAGPSIFALTLTPKNGVSLGVIESTSAIYAPTLTLAAYPIALTLIDSGGTTFAPTIIGGGSVFVFPDLIDGGAVVYALEVQPDQFLTISLIDGAPAIFSLTLATTNTVALGLIDGGSNIFAISMATRYAITLGFIESTPAIYEPTLVIGPATVSLGVIISTSTVYDLTTSGAQIIGPDPIESTSVVYALAVLVQPVSVMLDVIGTDSETYALTPTAISTLTLGLIESTAETYEPSFHQVLSVTLGLIDAVPALYAPALHLNIALDTIGDGPWIWALVAYADGVVEGSSDVSFNWSTEATGSAPILGPAESVFTWRSDGWGAYAAIFGTGASGWGYASYGGAGSEEMQGTGAPAFDWDTSSAAYVLHPSDSAFRFTSSGAGDAPVLGPSDVSFVWLPFGDGQVGITGAGGATSFTWATTGNVGAAGAVGSGASSFGWTTGASEGAVAEEVTGTAASDFNWTNGGGVGWHVEDDSAIGYSDVAFNWEAVSTTQVVPGTGYVSGGAGDTTWVTITS